MKMTIGSLGSLLIKDDFMKSRPVKWFFGACFVLAQLSAHHVAALGLSDIELKSALNQPFDATIRIIDTGGLTEDEIIVKLASKKDFEQAGIDRFYFLTELKFGVYMETDNSGVIHITTKDPVNEPYLDFILESQWPTGRLLREFTVLLDPPVYNETARVIPAISKPAPRGMQDTSSTVSKSSSSNGSENDPSATNQTQANRIVSNDDGYIKTTDETLWEIALIARPNSDYSIQQTMLALQDQNPRAFMRGNINLIKQHQKLKVPTPDQIRIRSLRQAERDVAYQNKMFSEGRRLPTKPRAIPLVASNTTKPLPKTDSNEVQSELKLVAPEGSSTAGASGGISAAKNGGEKNSTPEALENVLALTEENLDKSEQEKQDLTTRMAALEKNLETMQKLLMLKDEQLALLQAEVEQTDGKRSGTAVAVQEPTTVGAAEKAEPKQEIDAAIVASQTDTTKSTAEKKEPITEIGFSSIISNLYVWIGLAILAIIALLVVRARSSKNDALEGGTGTFDEDSGPLTDSDFNQEGLEDISGFDEVDEVSEVSDEFETTESVSTIGFSEPQAEVKAETSDVIAEADIYLAYGRAQSAVDILSSAIQEEPSRTDVRLKLLEVYADQNDSASFDQGLEQLASLGDENANQQAAELRTRMVVDDEIESEVDDLVFDLYQEDDEQDVAIEGASNFDTGIVALDESALDELDDDISGLGFETEDDAEAEAEGNIELPTFASEEASTDKVATSLEKSIAEHESRDEENIGGIDFEIDMEEFDLESDDDLLIDIDAPEEAAPAIADGIAFDEEDADLDSINMQMRIEAEAIVAQLQGEGQELAPSADAEETDDLDSLHMQIQQDISQDLGSSVDLTAGIEDNEVAAASDEPVANETDLDGYVDSVLGADESETKIDLARAYIEMEDFEGARELLKEVEQVGSAEQKQTVEQLLSELS